MNEQIYVPDEIFPSQDISDDMVAVFDELHAIDDGMYLPTEGGPVCGTPTEDTPFWKPQTTAFTCAVMAQRGIIAAFTGNDLSEAQLVYDATVNGWLTERGHVAARRGQALGAPRHPLP
ncbi:MAG: hypothetical protein ACT4QB_16240 [Gammaproteobacteria bacterium]